MRRTFGWSAIFAGVCITAACSLWPAQPPFPQLHDFGPPPALDHKHASAPQLDLDAVSAPAWLASDAIHYRLLYADPTALRNYADHRWAAPPAELLTARLQYLLPPKPSVNGNVHGAYLLSAGLLEFEQDFDAAHEAQVSLELEVSIRRSDDGKIIAARRFVMTQSTTADVQGAISGLAQLANRTAAEIADWAQTQVQD